MNDRANARITRLQCLEAELERARRRHARRSSAAPARSDPQAERQPRVESSSVRRWTAAFDDGAPILLSYDRAAQPATSRSGQVPEVHRSLSFDSPTEEPLRRADPPDPVAPAPPATVSPPGRPSGRETAPGTGTAVPFAPQPAATGTPSHRATDDSEEFAQDLLSILGGARGDAATTEAATTPTPEAAPQPSAPQPAAAAAPPTPAQLPPGVGAAQSHDIFDRMGEQLAYANRFDVGPVALNHVFDAFDRTIDRDERAGMTAGGGTAQASELESLDEQFDVAEVRAAHGDGQVFRVVHPVDLVPQVPGLTCWAAAAAMLVAWRDGVRAEASQVVDAAGYWERFAAGRAADGPPLDEWSVQVLDARSYDPRTMRSLLETHGPLLVAGAPPGPHVVVVSGLTGDGSSEGTIVDVVDPWAPGMTAFAMPNPGCRGSEPWSRFVARMAGAQAAGTASPGLTVGHLRPRETERSS